MLTRRRIQQGLAVLWLLDAALQLQPFMFTGGFAHDVIRPAAEGQPGPVQVSVHLAADVVAAQPVLVNLLIALVQLALAVGLVIRRTSTATLLASIAWSAGVWWFGEGAGGLLSGHAMLLTGAPGAALLYAALALAALPWGRAHSAELPPHRLVLPAWASLWLLGAVYQLLPGQSSVGAVADAVHTSAGAAPSALGSLSNHVADALAGHPLIIPALVVAQLAVAALAVLPGRSRQLSCGAGAFLAVVFWAFGQGLGGLTTGQATDPNSGPLMVLLALAVAAATRPPRTASAPGAIVEVPSAVLVAAG